MRTGRESGEGGKEEESEQWGEQAKRKAESILWGPAPITHGQREEEGDV